MSKPNTASLNDGVIDTIRSFLDSPPEGTPIEIIEAFNIPGSKSYLPPRLFLQTVEQAPMAISITNANARILYVNAAFEKTTGYKRTEVVGQNQSILSSKSTPLKVYRELWSTILDRRVWRGTLVNHRKNKEEYLAEVSISPVMTTNNEIGYFLGMQRNISEIHQLQQRLKYQKSLTEAAIDAAPMIVAMVGTDRKVLLDNLAYKALHGDFRGVEPATLFLEALQQQSGFDIGSASMEKGFSNIEIRLDPPGSSAPRWFSCSGACIVALDDAAKNYFKQSDSSSCCLMLIASEITANRERIQDARLNMIRASMVEQQMVQTMHEAISAAIYKLQVPLNVIKAALAMPTSGTDQSNLRSTLQEALESGDEAMQSLNAAIPSPMQEQASLVNINEILHEVLKLSTEKLLSFGVVVDWRPATVLAGISGRANALRGLFKYLLDNAIQAVNESEQNDKEIYLSTRIENQELMIEIRDNGSGLPRAQRLTAFEPFYCGWKQHGEHAGMGLTMAQEVAISHGGYVEIDSEFYGGCRVIVSLPLNASCSE